MAAKQIIAVRTRRVKGVEELTHLAEAHRDGKRWLTVRELLKAIEDGERYYFEAGGESFLLSVQKDEDGHKSLAVGFEPGAELLLTLPRDDR